MNDYLNDLLVWALVLAVLLPIIIALFKRHQVAIFVVGLLILIGALPAALMSEISINGCCGAPSTGYEGAGYLIGGIMAIGGILIMIFSKKLARSSK